MFSVSYNISIRFKNTDRPELVYAYLNKDQFPSELPTSLTIQVSTQSHPYECSHLPQRQYDLAK